MVCFLAFLGRRKFPLPFWGSEIFPEFSRKGAGSDRSASAWHVRPGAGPGKDGNLELKIGEKHRKINVLYKSNDFYLTKGPFYMLVVSSYIYIYVCVYMYSMIYFMFLVYV